MIHRLSILLLAGATLASATPVAEADFTGAQATNAGHLPPSPGNGFMWSFMGAGNFDVVADNGSPGIGSGEALRVDTTGGFQGAFGALPFRVNLRPGDTLGLSFTGRYTATPATNTGGMRFGFTTISSPDETFFVQHGTGASANFQLLRDSGENGGDQSPGTGGGLVSLSPASSGENPQPLANTPFHATLSITRHATEYALIATVNGSTLTATTGLAFTGFDSIFIRNGNINTPFIIDDVIVSLQNNGSPSEGGEGLTGDYFSGTGFTGLTHSRTDEALDFDWDGTPPAPGLGTSAWSVRWSGQIEPQASGPTMIHVVTPGGARLWIDEHLVAIRAFPDPGSPSLDAVVPLKAGKRVNIRLELTHHGGPSGVTLEWSPPGTGRQTIPGSALHPLPRAPHGGGLLKEHWQGIPGSEIDALTSSPDFPHKPAGREFLTTFESLARDWSENFGTRATGLLIPETSGLHHFAVSGSDTVELWLGPDENPVGLEKAAFTTSATGFREWSESSAAIHLEQGRRYRVELLHKAGEGPDHWSAGWKKPGDTHFSVIPGSALAQAGSDRPQPPRDALLHTLSTARPRLFSTPERFASLAVKLADAPSGKPAQWFAGAKSHADTLLATTPAPATTDVVFSLGLAWHVTGDPAYAERAWASLEAAADQAVWGGSTYDLTTAGILQACAIGYDWFHSHLTPTRREKLRTAILSKGLEKGISAHNANLHWTQAVSNNWNIVCNGALIVAALSLGDDAPATSRDALHRALNSVRPVMRRFHTDSGAWYEGPDYWYYTMNNLLPMVASLEWALGADFGLGSIPGLSETGRFAMHIHGPTGQTFNFGDAGSYRIRGPVMFWSARRHDRPLYTWWENTYSTGNIVRTLDALWHQPFPETPWEAGASPDACFRGPTATTAFKPQEIVTLRQGWNDNRATFIAAKGGEMGAAHGNLDSGSFVIDALGRRWAHELGYDDYNLPGFFGANRWTYYRNRSEGQNTLVINPGYGPEQIVGEVSPTILFKSGTDGARAIHDLTPVSRGVTRAWRGYQLLNNRREVIVQDEVTATSPAEAWWFMHINSQQTTATITPDGKSVMLTQGPERLWLRIVDGGGVFSLRDATPLPASPSPAGQNPNASFKKLAIHLTNITEMRLAVWMVPLGPGEEIPDRLPPITPLTGWAAGDTHPAIALTATGLEIHEAAGDTGHFTIHRDEPADEPLTIHFRLSGTATPGIDFTDPGSEITIPAGALSADIPITAIPDEDDEGAETITLTLTPGPYSIIGENSATLVIDDHAPSSVIFHDTFDVGAAPSPADDPDDPHDAEWTSTHPLSLQTELTPGSGNALRISPAGSFAAMQARFPARTLAIPGDSLQLQFDFRHATTPADNSGGFRFGFFNMDGDGFAANHGTGASTALALIEDHSADGGFGSGGTTSTLITGTGTSLSGTAAHSASLTLTRTTDGLTLTTSVNGTILSTHIEAPGTDTFDTLVIRNGGVFTPFLIDNVRLVSGRSLIESWRHTHFGPHATDPLVAGDGADPDGDGIPNLMEYALGSDPLRQDPGHVTMDRTSVDGRQHLRLTATKNPAATDTILEIQASRTLTGPDSWSTHGTIVEHDSHSLLIVRDADPMGEHPAVFMRVHVRRK